MSSDRSARLIGGAFIGAGVSHFARPDFFEAIVPRWFPDVKFANRASGAAEIVCGLGMFPRRTRRVAAFGLLGILAGVFPANVDMCINDVDVGRDDEGNVTRIEGAEGVRTRNLVRLPVQFLLAWLVWRHTGKDQAVNGSDL
jgi:uncharacterized membrane protein